MGRAGLLMLMLLAALGPGVRGHEGSGEPAGSPAPGPPELCLLPKVVGKCRAAFPRWWYNATSRACQPFTYGGCGANLNNFLVEDDCRVRCAAAGEESRGRIQPANNTFTYEERCLAKAATGLCRASFPRWWFDVESKTCRQFTYGGCGGNPNNYLSEAECLARCSESCAAPRLTGPCRAAFPRWYYDPAAQACKQFVYGGCKGNKNNYLQEELCLSQCRGAAGEGGACSLGAARGPPGRLPAARQGLGGAEGPEPGAHSTRAVALAVLLAILVAVLLGSVVVFFVWLCRRSQELSLSVPWSPLDDKEYLMSNAYTL
ncbi:kunitz-type protease inhibitor 2 isoform X5 [Caretta caretta]|uniref:kunitz-type protease inhibitor 2 isoform X5 n=1 Tax=Caretta caretta TaxID=8467 RepID=UPI003F4C272C